MNVSNNVILARNRQLPDDDRMIETCWSICKSFNINNLSVCIGWCADQVNIPLSYPLQMPKFTSVEEFLVVVWLILCAENWLNFHDAKAKMGAVLIVVRIFGIKLFDFF